MIGIKVRYNVILSFMIFLTLYCNDENIFEGNTMNNTEQYSVKIIVGDTILSAALENNPTARDFISLLPLDLKLDDYSGIEKISYLPKKLSTERAPSGFDPSVGDITYYAPWGNLAIFYKDFGYASGLIHLGKIDHGINVFDTSASVNVRIELVQ